MTHTKCSPSLIHVCLLLAVALTLAVPASAQWKEQVLYSFQGGTNDGSVPAGGVMFDKQGNLFGATPWGRAPPPQRRWHAFPASEPPAMKGDPWTETLIYQFQGESSKDGSEPSGGLIMDAAGNLYGVTAYGGTGNCKLLGSLYGCGTVYELSPPQQQGEAWTETILYSFPTAKQGYENRGSGFRRVRRNLYGATSFGGGKGTTCDEFYGGNCGAVFELSPPKTKGGKWTEKVLHAFASGTDGANPNGGLVLDSKGAVYGTTSFGGFAGGALQTLAGRGIVFQAQTATESAAPGRRRSCTALRVLPTAAGLRRAWSSTQRAASTEQPSVAGEADLGRARYSS